MSGCRCIWSSPGDDPLLEKLDRVLVSTNWEDKFPLSSVEARHRNTFDHTPHILNTGTNTLHNNQRPFKF
jgi:hypothetical protein